MTLRPDFHFFGHWNEFFMEIAKMRAARFMWAKIIEEFKPRIKKSC